MIVKIRTYQDSDQTTEEFVHLNVKDTRRDPCHFVVIDQNDDEVSYRKETIIGIDFE